MQVLCILHPESGIFQPSFGLFYGDLMKIIDVKATPIYIPMKHPLRWSMGIEPGTTRTIVELITDEGVTGLGEAWGGAEIAHAIERAKPLFIGTDPLEVSRLAKRFSIYRLSSEQMTYSAQMKFVGSPQLKLPAGISLARCLVSVAAISGAVSKRNGWSLLPTSFSAMKPLSERET